MKPMFQQGKIPRCFFKFLSGFVACVQSRWIANSWKWQPLTVTSKLQPVLVRLHTYRLTSVTCFFSWKKNLFAWAWHVFIPNFPTKHPRKLMDMATKGCPVLAIISCRWLGGQKMWPQKYLSKEEPSPQVQEHLLCWFCRGDHLSEVTLPYLAAWLVGWWPCWICFSTIISFFRTLFFFLHVSFILFLKNIIF